MSNTDRTTTAASTDIETEATGINKEQIRQTVDDIRAEVGREVGARAQQVRDWAETQADQVRTTVVEKPFASAGAAFAAGVILGILLARR